MRFPHILLAPIAALALGASAASAQTVSIAPIAISADLQKDLDDTLGAREADTLRTLLMHNLERALQREGVVIGANSALTIEADIVDADPNRPTFQEQADNVSLSYSGSISTGGARLRATLRGAGGAREISYHRYSHNLDEVVSPGVWSDANRAMTIFARRVARAIKESAQ